MKSLTQKLGLFLFLVAFGIFLASFFLSHYQVEWKGVESRLGDKDRLNLLKSTQKSANVVGKLYKGNFTFVSEWEDIFKEANQFAIGKYGIDITLSERFVKAQGDSYPVHFSLSKIQGVLGDKEKFKAFQTYGGWMEGREYASSEQLKGDIDVSLKNINEGVIRDKGFDKYRIKALKYELAKEGTVGFVSDNALLFLLLVYGMGILGALLYNLPRLKTAEGLSHNGIYHSAMKNRGWLGILSGTFLIAFYIVLYFFPEYMTSWVVMVDPISYFLKASEAGHFFLYGWLYTICVGVMGVRMMIKWRDSNYHIIRTCSVIFFQTAFAFLIPEILIRLNLPYYDFKNIWPLDYDFFFDYELNGLIQSGAIGIFMLVWGITLMLIGVPVMVYFFGKRWYCSWVCGCGGLAETLGDPYRQLSDKSLKAWKVERWLIHLVLVFAVVMTLGVLYTYFTGHSNLFGIVDTYSLRGAYGFLIGAGFAGVVGTGFYPLMGNRAWCRFGCPLAAYLGLVQRFKSRFRITTNGGQCISCGNCSTYCEMGIDVRWYAQRGQNIVRSSCVGCGVCSSVCPRGVLKLENTDEEGRFNDPILIGNDSIDVKK